MKFLYLILSFVDFLFPIFWFLCRISNNLYIGGNKTKKWIKSQDWWIVTLHLEVSNLIYYFLLSVFYPIFPFFFIKKSCFLFQSVFPIFFFLFIFHLCPHHQTNRSCDGTGSIQHRILPWPMYGPPVYIRQGTRHLENPPRMVFFFLILKIEVKSFSHCKKDQNVKGISTQTGCV